MLKPALALIALCMTANAETFIRWNQAGYPHDRPIRLVIMSESDLADQEWTLTLDDLVLQTGPVGESVSGTGPNTPFPFNHEVTLAPELETDSSLVFSVNGESATLLVSGQPYRKFLPEPFVHLRMMRSGRNTVPPRQPSHLGDADTPVWVPDGDPAGGKWKLDPLGRTVDAEGGWYDAGDQLKFTLNTAYVVYHLLLAHEMAPELFPSPENGVLPEILQEARHGLNWLMKLHPDHEIFIVQVGDEDDHNQPLRLPEDDRLDGQRPALCALSRVHMNAAAAALAMGALTWESLGLAEEARRFGDESIRIFRRAQKPDTVLSAFERGEVNDFYHDKTLEDQLALAGVTLHRWTGEPGYLEIAVKAAPAAGFEPSWHSWHWSANRALSAFDPSAAARLCTEAGRYTENARTSGQPWGIPGRYVWGSLHRWIEMGLVTELARRSDQCPGPDVPAGGSASTVFDDMIDYVFGRNNWGVSFLFSPQLPNSLQNLYSPAYGFLELFPTGALSEGPGNADTHQKLERYFEIPDDDPAHRFNTPEVVFFDNNTDFMCQEATITGQADIILLLTLASRP